MFFWGFDCEDEDDDEEEANKREKKRFWRGFSQPGSAGVSPAFSLGSINSPPGRRRSRVCAPAFPVNQAKRELLQCKGGLNHVLAAGFLAACSRIVSSTLFGTCSNVSGSIEYDARPLDSERMAVA